MTLSENMKLSMNNKGSVSNNTSYSDFIWSCPSG